MSTCLLLIDDGREDYLDRCLESLGPLLETFTTDVVVRDPDHELGFAGAIQAGWDEVLETGCEFVLHAESDFIFTRLPPLRRMEPLARLETIAQVALKRQPWNETERAVGGIVEANPAAYEERVLTFDAERASYPYTVHRQFFTTNPSLYRTAICKRGWPQEPESEGKFGIQLFNENPHIVSAFWGGKFDPPMVEHIGRERAGVGY